MKPEQQRIAIAKACGWKIHSEKQVTIIGWLYTTPKGKLEDTLPDYLSDLNAMHEAEMTLGVIIGQQYIEELGKLMDDMLWIRLVCATAAQRAEAFLRTLNLWTDEAHD